MPSLDNLIHDVTKEIEEPRTPGQSVYADWVTRAWSSPCPPIDRLGGGYDYEVWIDHLGIPTIQMSFDYPASGQLSQQLRRPLLGRSTGAIRATCTTPPWRNWPASPRCGWLTPTSCPSEYSRYAGEVAGYLTDLNARLQRLHPDTKLNFDRELAQARAWGTAAAALEGKSEAILAGNDVHPAGPERAGGLHQPAADAAGA